jgi:hypothetical protein
MAYAQQIKEDMHASPTGGQAARYDSNEPSGIPHADPNHRAISCRLPEVHAVGKPLRRKLAWWISKIATNHFNYQPNHNSRDIYFADPTKIRSSILFDGRRSSNFSHPSYVTLLSLVHSPFQLSRFILTSRLQSNLIPGTRIQATLLKGTRLPSSL